MYFVKKVFRLWPDAFGIIMQMFSVYKNWAEINSAIPCTGGEIWSLFCPQGLGGTSPVCFSYFCDKTPKNCESDCFLLKLRFLWLCVSAPVHADTRAGLRAHIHPPERCAFSVWVALELAHCGALTCLVRTWAACGSHYGSGSLARLSQTHKHTGRRGTVAPWEGGSQG